MNNIAIIRKIRGLSQADLADMVSTTQPSISRIEKGDDGTTLRQFIRIAEALRVELADLFSDERSTSERLLLEAFRNLPPDMKRSWVAMARSVVETPPQEAQENGAPAPRSSSR